MVINCRLNKSGTDGAFVVINHRLHKSGTDGALSEFLYREL